MGKADRPSPSESATLFPAGTKKKGNDGNMYVIQLDKNGRPSWKKHKADGGAKAAATATAMKAKPMKAAPTMKSTGKPVKKGDDKSMKKSSPLTGAASNPKSGYPLLQIAKALPKNKGGTRTSDAMKPFTISRNKSRDGKAYPIPQVSTSGKVVAKFKTSEWKEDPGRKRMREDLGFDFLVEHEEEGNEIGGYHLVFMDVVDGGGKKHELTIVANEGDGDCNTGFWGGVYLRNTPSHDEVAQISSVGDTSTEVRSTGVGKKMFKEYPKAKGRGPLFPPNSCFVDTFEMDSEALDPTAEHEFKGPWGSLRPGTCKDQLSRFVGCVMTEYW